MEGPWDDAASTANQQRPNYLAEILSLCTTFTSEAIDTAGGKAKVNGFNVDRGEITFTEVTINLIQARETLVDAIQKQKLIRLPITVQKVLANLQSIEKALQGLMSNSDQIENLGVAVEVLNTSIWKYGLHNLSDQVLGYQTKLNQLKQQDIRGEESAFYTGRRPRYIRTAVGAGQSGRGRHGTDWQGEALSGAGRFGCGRIPTTSTGRGCQGDSLDSCGDAI